MAHMDRVFTTRAHHLLTNILEGRKDALVTHLYTLGNPLLAQTMMQRDRRAALHVPPRLLVLEKDDRMGTEVTYILPSSLIAVSPSGVVDEELQKAAEVVDEKFERLVQWATREL